MPTLYCLQKCLHRDFLILQGFSTILFSNFFVCKHFAIFSTFLNFPKLLNPLFYGLFTTTVLIFLARTTWTLYSHIICIICIYNITCISGFSRLGNIYIICIIRIIYIINISLLWTNCGHRPHPFTAIIIPYFKVQ